MLNGLKQSDGTNGTKRLYWKHPIFDLYCCYVGVPETNRHYGKAAVEVYFPKLPARVTFAGLATGYLPPGCWWFGALICSTGGEDRACGMLDALEAALVDVPVPVGAATVKAPAVKKARRRRKPRQKAAGRS